jgi:hypothetical protein
VGERDQRGRADLAEPVSGRGIATADAAKQATIGETTAGVTIDRSRLCQLIAPELLATSIGDEDERAGEALMEPVPEIERKPGDHDEYENDV